MIRYEDCQPVVESQTNLRPNLTTNFQSPARLLCELGGVAFNLEMSVIGPSGNTASISADEGNMLREGSDGKLYSRMEWTGTPNW